MPIQVKLSPFIRKYIPGYDHVTGILLTIDAPCSVEQIIAELGLPREEVVSVMINGYPGKITGTVNDGDCITLAKVVGGG